MDRAEEREDVERGAAAAEVGVEVLDVEGGGGSSENVSVRPKLDLQMNVNNTVKRQKQKGVSTYASEAEWAARTETFQKPQTTPP